MSTNLHREIQHHKQISFIYSNEATPISGYEK